MLYAANDTTNVAPGSHDSFQLVRPDQSPDLTRPQVRFDDHLHVFSVTFIDTEIIRIDSTGRITLTSLDERSVSRFLCDQAIAAMNDILRCISVQIDEQRRVHTRHGDHGDDFTMISGGIRRELVPPIMHEDKERAMHCWTTLNNPRQRGGFTPLPTFPRPTGGAPPRIHIPVMFAAMPPSAPPPPPPPPHPRLTSLSVPVQMSVQMVDGDTHAAVNPVVNPVVIPVIHLDTEGFRQRHHDVATPMASWDFRKCSCFVQLVQR